jgi:carbon-monoxide dehydrogenase large subunit
MTIDGTYKIETDTPMGKQEGTLVLKTDGDKLSGTAESMMGKQEFTGTISGDSLTWTMKMTSPMGDMELVWTAKVTGDAIAGEVKAGNFGSSPFKGKRI